MQLTAMKLQLIVSTNINASAVVLHCSNQQPAQQGLAEGHIITDIYATLYHY